MVSVSIWRKRRIVHSWSGLRSIAGGEGGILRHSSRRTRHIDVHCCWRRDCLRWWPSWSLLTVTIITPKVYYISRWHQLKFWQLKAIRQIKKTAFAWLSLAPLYLNTGSMVPAGEPFQRRCWPADQRSTMKINGGITGFHRVSICCLSIRTTVAIERFWLPFHGQVEGWGEKQNHQKEEPVISLPCRA